MATNLNPMHTGPGVTLVPVQPGHGVAVPNSSTAPGTTGVLVRTIHDGDDMYFEQNFPTPQGDWLVRHNLGKYPNVALIDSDGNEFFADVNFPDMDTVHVTFPTMMTGKVICS